MNTLQKRYVIPCIVEYCKNSIEPNIYEELEKLGWKRVRDKKTNKKGIMCPNCIKNEIGSSESD